MREDIRQKDLQKDYDALDNKKSLGQLTLAQELTGLEKIKAAHKLNAEELADIQERLYSVRKLYDKKTFKRTLVC